MLLVTAGDDIEKPVLEGLGDGAALAFTDLAIVDLADRCHLGGGTSQEDLVGDVEIVAGEGGFLNGDALSIGERFSPLASETSPWVSSMIASS